jgi:hypothetical protein
MNLLFSIAHASSPGVAQAQAFVAKINDIILFPLIALLSAVAILVFMYGAFMYVANGDNSTARAEGQKHILWGIVGLIVMLSAFTILSVAANTFGLKDELDCADNPDASGCGGAAVRLPSP